VELRRAVDVATTALATATRTAALATATATATATRTATVVRALLCVRLCALLCVLLCAPLPRTVLATARTTTAVRAVVGAKPPTWIELFLPVLLVKMDTLRASDASLQALWPQIPSFLQMDVLDILRSDDLTEEDKMAAMEAAVLCKTQDAFIPFNPLLKSARDEAADATDALLYKPEISKLNFPCVFCKSKNTIVMSKQTRSADESTPVSIICLDCGKRSVERG